MKVLVILASHRRDGKNQEIENAMRQYESLFNFDFVHLADYKIEGCTSCHKCGEKGYCVLPQDENDRFQEIFDKMVYADTIFIISPVYANIPSRLTALFERLTSVLFDTGRINTDANPLLNKNAAVFSYCSCSICDDSNIKLIFDKFLMKNYRYDYTTYNYLNQESNPNENYSDITDYVLDTLKKLMRYILNKQQLEVCGVRAGGTRYYVRIRTYKKIGNGTFYNTWNTGLKSVVTLK